MKDSIVVCTLSDQQVGMTTTYAGPSDSTGPQRVVRSNYGMAEFPIDTVEFNADGIPQLVGDRYIGNSPKINFLTGGLHAPLWGQDIQPRAKVAQLNDNGTVLHYMKDSQNTIGRVLLSGDDSGKVIEPLGPIKGPKGDYFLQLRDNRFAVIESLGPGNPCALRIYGVSGDKLKLDIEKELGFSLAYGLCQDNEDELMMLVPKQESYPIDSNQKPGFYRISVKEGVGLDELVRDTRFDEFNLPTDLRSLVPVFGKDGQVPGFLAGDYKFTRTKGKSGCGGNGSIFWLPMEQK